jgi:hypothetical protein
MLDDPQTQAAVARIVPLIPWAIERLQSDIDPLRFIDLRPGRRAGIVHDWIMAEAKRRFDGSDDVTVVDSNGLHHFVIPGALLRVKMARRRRFRIATNDTVQTRRWVHQLPLGPDIDPRSHLHLVYCPDATWTAVERCGIGLYHGNELVPGSWLELDASASTESGPLIDHLMVDQGKLPQLKLKPQYRPRRLVGFDEA